MFAMATRRKKPTKRLSRQITDTHSLPHWSGYQKDLAHYIRSTARSKDSTFPVAEVLEHILHPVVTTTKIRVPDPNDLRKTIEKKATIINLDLLKNGTAD